MYLKSKLFWAQFLRLLTEGYIDISLSCLINIQNINFSNASVIIDQVVKFVLLLIIIFLPIIVTVFMEKKKLMLKKQIFKEQYDSLYDGFDIRSASNQRFIGLFYLRRLLFSITCVFLTDHPAFQVQLYLLSSIINSTYIGLSKPYEGLGKNRVEIFNEVTIFAVGTHLVALTDFVDDEDTRTIIGWSLIAVVMINIAYHILTMLWMIYKTVLKPLFLKIKHKCCGATNS